MAKTILTGDRPTGPLHLGHYVGSLRQRVALLCRRLLRRPAAESGRLCHANGGHEWGARRRRALMLPILLSTIISL